MRVAVVGPGAIGATFGAAAEEAGHEVVLCGRRPAPAPVVERPDGSEHALAAEVESDPSAADGPVPWVLLAVKAHQTAGRGGLAARALRRRDDRRRPAERRRAPRARRPARGRGDRPADRRVVPVGDGRARSRPAARRGRGSPSPTSRRAPRSRALFEGSGAGVDPTADFTTETWRKLAVNAVAGLMAVTRRRAEVFRGDGCAGRDRARRASASRSRAPRAPASTRRRRGGRRPARVVPAGPRHVDPLRPPRRPADGVGRAQRRRLPPRRRAHGIETPVSDVLVPLLAALDEAPA